MKNLCLKVIIIVLSLCKAAYADRTTWYVHPDSALNTIQAGLDSCADNDTVLVGAGTYVENLVWPNTLGINLISELGPGATIIDGGNTASVISLDFDSLTHSATIRGFTIRNGNTAYGGGIFARGVVCYILDNIISDNSASCGGGIYAAVHSELAGLACHVHDNIISDNSASHGGGIYFRGGPMIGPGSFEISGNTITNNDAVERGGGICTAQLQHTHINTNIITYNMASNGGGVFTDFSPDPENDIVTISNNIINHNTAAEHGGGIGSVDTSSWGGVVDSVVGNIMVGNLAGYGGGVSARMDYVYGNTICDNSALHNGGAMEIWGGPSVVRCNEMTDNSAVNDVDGIYIHTWNSDEIIIDSNDIYANGYGLYNPDTGFTVNAEHNWWGDASGPYHPTANPGGLGDTVSDYVDFEPWLFWPVGVEEQPIAKPLETHETLHATIFRGPLHLPEGKTCRVFDITGRVVEPDKITRGIYFVEIDNKIVQKVVKIR